MKKSEDEKAWGAIQKMKASLASVDWYDKSLRANDINIALEKLNDSLRKMEEVLHLKREITISN